MIHVLKVRLSVAFGMLVEFCNDLVKHVFLKVIILRFIFNFFKAPEMSHWILVDREIIGSEREQKDDQRQRLLLYYLTKRLRLINSKATVPLELRKMIELLVCSQTYSNIVLGTCFVCGDQESVFV